MIFCRKYFWERKPIKNVFEYWMIITCVRGLKHKGPKNWFGKNDYYNWYGFKFQTWNFGCWYLARSRHLVCFLQGTDKPCPFYLLFEHSWHILGHVYTYGRPCCTPFVSLKDIWSTYCYFTASSMKIFSSLNVPWRHWNGHNLFKKSILTLVSFFASACGSEDSYFPL